MKVIVDWDPDDYGTTSHEFVLKLMTRLHKLGIVASAKQAQQAIDQRRQLGDTLVATNVAIPHIQSSTVKQAIILFVKLPAGLNDYQPGYQVDRFVFILLPTAAAKNDLKHFQKLFQKLADDTVMSILSHGDRKSVTNLLQLKGE